MRFLIPWLVASVAQAAPAEPLREAPLLPEGSRVHDTALDPHVAPVFALPGLAPDAGLAAPSSATWRRVRVAPAPFLPPGVAAAPVEDVQYDLELALMAVTPAQLEALPAWSLAVRLVLSEVGASRLLDNRWGLAEAVAVLQTVRNRLDPEVWNPAGIERFRGYLGCDPGRGGTPTFNTCADPRQYLGLARPRALRPRTATRDPMRLLAAIDLAVAAWWLVDTELTEDLTGGATAFVHRCGGTAYGEPTTRCDGRASVPDIPGAHPHRGPLALKGPGAWLPRRGHYSLERTATIDYVRGPHPTAAGAVLDALGLLDAPWPEEDFSTDPAELDALWDDGLDGLGEVPGPDDTESPGEG